MAYRELGMIDTMAPLAGKLRGLNYSSTRCLKMSLAPCNGFHSCGISSWRASSITSSVTIFSARVTRSPARRRMLPTLAGAVGGCGLTAAMAGMCYGAYQVPCPDPSVIPVLGGSPPPSGNPHLLGGRK